MEEQKKGNSYEIVVEEGKWNTRSYVVLLYLRNRRRGTVMKYSCTRREIKQTKLCSTFVWRNRRRETVMKYSCRRRDMEHTKLCSTLAWRNRRRETVMKYSYRRREMEQTKLCSTLV